MPSWAIHSCTGAPACQLVGRAAGRPQSCNLTQPRRVTMLADTPGGCYHIDESRAERPRSAYGNERLGILTGGGDVPGLNSLINPGGVRGSGARLRGGRDPTRLGRLDHVESSGSASRHRYVLPLNRQNTRTIDRTGGTYLHIRAPARPGCTRFPRRSRDRISRQRVLEHRHHLRRYQAVQRISSAGARLPGRHRPAMTRSGTRRSSPGGACRDSVPKTMDNRCARTEYVSGFPPRSPAPWMPSSDSGPRSAPMSASAFSGCRARSG